jgi:DNA polymerase-3 subunit alpha
MTQNIKPNQKFVHLHLHTEYSLLDGAIRILDIKGKPAEMFSLAKKYDMPAIAITDHGNMYGVIEFYKSARSQGIKPIIGCEVYLAPNSRFEKQTNKSAERYFHLTLLCENEEGYKNLMKLVSIGYLEGFYYKPRIDKEVLKQHSKGLIALSGCMQGEIPQSILDGNDEKTKKIINDYLDIFGTENFYFELQDNGINEQKIIRQKLIELSKEFSVQCVATNDAHYLHNEDSYLQEILLCIGTAKVLTDSSRMKFTSDEFYFKSPLEMIELFKDIPEAIENTIKIADRCNLEIDFSKMYLPAYEVPDGYDESSYLRYLCEKELPARYKIIDDTIKQRLEHELKIIIQMGFPAYFLIVYDFIKYARENGVSVGPGRGSGAGSIVAYLLRITDVDPLRYGLIFERFLNPSRISMPDLDIDFADTGREKIIEYVRNKYGAKNVAQIITFGSMQARLAIRDVGRVMDIPLSEVDKVAKLIPTGETIYEAMNSVDDLKKLVATDKRLGELLKVSQKIEGIKRHVGVHAAGLLISKGDMTDYVPFTKSSKGVVTTQYEGESLVSLGLLKMDFLGLKNLSIIDDAVKLIKQHRNLDIDIENLALDDENTYKLLKEGKSNGVFQMESSGMRDLLKKLRPDNIEDIIALIALYRPGPMGSGMLDDFVNRKHGKSKITYDHPLLEPILKETNGVILYQEQVMQMAVVLAGFTAAQADNLRKAMGKKIPEILEKERTNFSNGAIVNKVKKEIAEKVFDNIVKFGGYGFNKSHSTAYGIVSYRTAYLKANYPVEYMTALLNNDLGNTDKIAYYVSECLDMDIKILPPDIQRSYAKFSVENLDKKEIRFGFFAIKSIGEGSADEIVKARENKDFESITDLLRRVESNSLNKKVIENLAKVGAFDSLGYTRASVCLGLENVLANVNRTNKDFGMGQISLFANIDEQVDTNEGFPVVPEWHEHEFLGYEKEALGFYISGHPLVNLAKEIKYFSKISIADLNKNFDKRDIQIVGFVNNIKKLKTKKGDNMCFVNLEDLTGETEVILFPKTFNEYGNAFEKDDIVFIKGKVDVKDEEKFTIFADSVMKFSDAKLKLCKKWIINIDKAVVEKEDILSLQNMLSKFSGHCEVILNVNTRHHGYVKIATKLKITPTTELEQEIKKMFGENCIQYIL